MNVIARVALIDAPVQAKALVLAGAMTGCILALGLWNPPVLGQAILAAGAITAACVTGYYALGAALVTAAAPQRKTRLRARARR
ncbi:hypothetical protein [Catenuloplanes atrovinosus]|uniref:Uncharacterized protein n=1 Tax=Catenuloplanes atrovinosus TaxID=137266 RepID=A0AAE4CBR8_9ACTN|nr:hypothetical protein [Catenuloplanes atrovinosus]MDR7278921.1 hypothetical protein [Catenuloplanes atrovinosus]